MTFLQPADLCSFSQQQLPTASWEPLAGTSQVSKPPLDSWLKLWHNKCLLFSAAKYWGNFLHSNGYLTYFLFLNIHKDSSTHPRVIMLSESQNFVLLLKARLISLGCIVPPAYCVLLKPKQATISYKFSVSILLATTVNSPIFHLFIHPDGSSRYQGNTSL